MMSTAAGPFFEWFKKAQLDSFANRRTPKFYHLYKIFPYWISILAKRVLYDRPKGSKIYEPISMPPSRRL